MFLSQHTKLLAAWGVAVSLLLCTGLSRSAYAQDEKPNHEPTNITVIVKEADTGEPISQAHITLQFWAPRGQEWHSKGKKIVYNAKTDSQGRCKLLAINKGTIVLAITAPSHQAYGKELQLEDDNQVFEVKLKKPQPLI